MKKIYSLFFVFTLFGCCETYINTEILKQPITINSKSLDGITGNIVKEKILFHKQFENLSCREVVIFENSIPSDNEYEFGAILYQTCNSSCSWQDSYNKITESDIVKNICQNSADPLILFMVNGDVSDTGATETYCNQYGFCSSSKVYSISQTFYPLIKTNQTN